MKVLVCPLDWGLGHATRSIPMIRALRRLGHDVMIAAGGGGLHLLRQEFPDLPGVEFPGYRVRYSRSAWAFLPYLLWQAPAIAMGLWRESRQLRRLIREHHPDLVLSDGRYGLRSKIIPCIFITHQIFLRVPGSFPGRAVVERMVRWLNLHWLKGFSEVWVPDFPGAQNLSGALSHAPGLPPQFVFIGPLSRFSSDTMDGKTSGRSSGADTNRASPSCAIDVLAMVSGPEPQRSQFESILRKQMESMAGTRVLVRGLPSGNSGHPAADGPRSSPSASQEIIPGRFQAFDHAPGDLLSDWMRSARWVVARSGYTTLMEMAGLHLRAVLLVPTPGQSEQEYLAEHLCAQGIALRQSQSGLDLQSALLAVAGLQGFGSRFPIDAGTLDGFLAGHPRLRSQPREERVGAARDSRQLL